MLRATLTSPATRDGLTFPSRRRCIASFSGGGQLFITKLNPAGSGLVYSSFFGGDSSSNYFHEPGGVAVNAAGDTYVTGATHDDTPPPTRTASSS